MKKIHLWLLSFLSGVLLALAWPAHGFTPLIFIAFLPLFWVENYVLEKQQAADLLKADRTKADTAGTNRHLPGNQTDSQAESESKKNGGKNRKIRYHIFGYSYLAFLVWNALTTWWIWYSTPAAVLAFAANALLMAATFTLFHYTCRHFFKKGMRWSILFIYWIAFEYFHHNWDISWPWLTLGNVFATRPQWIQWYEITGTLGGSLWVLACNVALFYWLNATLHHQKTGIGSTRKPLITACCLILIPVVLSLFRYASYEEKGKPVEVVVVQPNIDPYHEQFRQTPLEATDRMLRLAQTGITPQTRFVVTPESMIQENIWEEILPHSASIQRIQEFLQNWPETQVVAGISSYSRVKPEDSTMQGVRRLHWTNDPYLKYYRAHNTVITLSANRNMPIPLHHKAKLTPGVEIMPFTDKLEFLENLAIDLGGTVGTLGIDPGPTVFISDNPSSCRVTGGSYAAGKIPVPETDTVRRIAFSDIICYESVFGDYVASCVREGAELLFVSTNDGWWKNTPGHRQHAAYARLRAVENRRDIARSANTGISCFIDQKGNVSQATAYWEPACIRQTLLANDKQSFYSRYGDILGRCCLPLSLFFVLLTFIYRLFPGAWKEHRRCKAEV